MNKSDWYKSLHLNTTYSEQKCKEYGTFCIVVVESEKKNGKLYACVNEDCKTGFFKDK